MRILPTLLLFAIPLTSSAMTFSRERPSYRTIKERGEEFKDNEGPELRDYGEYLGPRGMSTVPYTNTEYGFTVQHIWSWEVEDWGLERSPTGENYLEVEFVPDQYRRHANRVLRVAVNAYTVPAGFTASQLDAYAREEFQANYRELYVRTAESDIIAGAPAMVYYLWTMTGWRKEAWVLAESRIVVLKYRSLDELYERDVHFFDEFVETLQLITPTNQLQRNANDTTSGPGAGPGAGQSVREVTEDGLFIDVPQNHAYVEAIAWAVEEGVVQGYEDGSFRPDNDVNRAELLKMVFVSDPSPDPDPVALSSFIDVSLDAWYRYYVDRAYARGIVQGYEDGSFRGGNTVNAAEALKMIYEAAQIQTQADTSTWFARYRNHALENDILYDPNLSMHSGMTRKDVVWILWRIHTLTD